MRGNETDDMIRYDVMDGLNSEGSDRSDRSIDRIASVTSGAGGLRSIDAGGVIGIDRARLLID